MDVRFREGRNHRREARVRAAGSARVRRARFSEARLRRIFFSLTKTYMEVSKPYLGITSRLPVIRGCLQSVLTSHLAVPRFRGLRREKHMANTNSAAHVRVIEETPAYWRVVFDYPPFNIVDASIFEALQDLLARINGSPSLRVVVFESANPEFYLAHFDLTGKIGNIMTAVGPSGLPILMDTFVRLTKSPVVSIAKIRGCARGAS